MVLGFVIQQIVECGGHFEGLAEALCGGEFPQGVGRVVDGVGALGDVVVVDELHVLHLGEEASIEREA